MTLLPARPAVLLSDVANQLPPLKQGIMYSVLDSKIKYLTTVEVLNLNNVNMPKWATCVKNLDLEFGYSTEETGVVIVSYPIVKLKDLGVTMPILDLIECNVGVAAGMKRIGLGAGNAKGNNEFDWGVTATLINIKF